MAITAWRATNQQWASSKTSPVVSGWDDGLKGNNNHESGYTGMKFTYNYIHCLICLHLFTMWSTCWYISRVIWGSLVWKRVILASRSKSISQCIPADICRIVPMKSSIHPMVSLEHWALGNSSLWGTNHWAKYPRSTFQNSISCRFLFRFRQKWRPFSATRLGHPQGLQIKQSSQRRSWWELASLKQCVVNGRSFKFALNEIDVDSFSYNIVSCNVYSMYCISFIPSQRLCISTLNRCSSPSDIYTSWASRRGIVDPVTKRKLSKKFSPFWGFLRVFSS